MSNSQANDDENDHSFAARAEELVDSLQTWQDFILAHGDESALQHPVFLGLMEEMQVQGLIDENWCWLVGV